MSGTALAPVRRIPWALTRKGSDLSPSKPAASKGLSEARNGGFEAAAEIGGGAPEGIAREYGDRGDAIGKLDDIGAAAFAQRDAAAMGEEQALLGPQDADAEPIGARSG